MRNVKLDAVRTGMVGTQRFVSDYYPMVVVAYTKGGKTVWALPLCIEDLKHIKAGNPSDYLANGDNMRYYNDIDPKEHIKFRLHKDGYYHPVNSISNTGRLFIGTAIDEIDREF